MKKIAILILLILLNNCAYGTYTSRDGDNSNLNHDTLYCKSLARSKHPGYICKNPLMCSPEEVNIVLNDMFENDFINIIYYVLVHRRMLPFQMYIPLYI